MKMLRMCLNWKALAGLALAGVGIYLVAPDLGVAALPLLVLAACPLSMVLMMRSMRRPQGHGKRTPQGPAVDLLAREERIAQQASLADQLGALERKGGHPPDNGRGQ